MSHHDREMMTINLIGIAGLLWFVIGWALLLHKAGVF